MEPAVHDLLCAAANSSIFHFKIFGNLYKLELREFTVVFVTPDHDHYNFISVFSVSLVTLFVDLQLSGWLR